ncbi:hypothetical protein [Planktothricoides sp. SR001]|nr:hypothetical protein [Planktothricoides sp. SR001]
MDIIANCGVKKRNPVSETSEMRDRLFHLLIKFNLTFLRFTKIKLQ